MVVNFVSVHQYRLFGIKTFLKTWKPIRMLARTNKSETVTFITSDISEAPMPISVFLCNFLLSHLRCNVIWKTTISTDLRFCRLSLHNFFFQLAYAFLSSECWRRLAETDKICDVTFPICQNDNYEVFN